MTKSERDKFRNALPFFDPAIPDCTKAMIELLDSYDRLEERDRTKAEALKNFENDNGSIPAHVWEMRNKALEESDHEKVP